MKRIGIFYFSGTGNTEIIARLLSASYQRKHIKVELFRIEDIVHHKTPLITNEFDMIGVGHPVLGFGASSITEQFAKILPPCSGKKAFIFKTASSAHYINHGASDSIIHTMEEKGYLVFHNSILAMPCNWFIKYDDQLNKQLYGAAVKKVDKIVTDTINEQAQQLKINGILSKFLRILYYGEEHYGAKYFARGLSTSDNCNLCNKCIRNCPTHNILETAVQICFGSHCIWCMRCIYGCPTHAIQARNLTGCVVDPYTGGFNIDSILNNPEINGNFVTEKSKGYYKHFIAYFKEAE
jgi:flavodoxin/ferredoxin